MKIFNFFGNKKNTVSSKKRYYNRGKYNIVSGWGTNVPESTEEHRTEDEILTKDKRLRLIDLSRNLVRNSNLFCTILGQLQTNVVSTNGGKCIANFKDNELNKLIKKYFSEYTRNVEFFSGSSFNHLLKRVLREIIITGDCVLVFDDGLVEDSGKILFFEAEEICDITAEDLQRIYGSGSYQIQGKIYSPNGRWIGTTVSRSGRGQDVVSAKQAYCLKRDPNGNPLDNLWYQPENLWREGRGVSQASAAIGTIHDLENLVTSEILASKRNSQIFCWLTQQAKTEEETIPSGFDDVEGMSDDEVEEVTKEEAAQTQTISFNRAKENSIVYEALPEGIDAKQLQLQHPNSNIEVMVDFLANRCAATLGLSKSYATGNVDDGSWRANQLFSAGAILDFQKQLEQICDWVLFRYFSWLNKKGKFDISQFGDDWMKYIDWSWRKIDDLDQVAHQQAIEMGLRNCTMTLRDALGSDYLEKLDEISEDIKYCKDHNIPHPAFNMKSGGERSETQELTIEE